MTYSDIKLQQKLTYLRRLLAIRVNLMKFCHGVDVSLEKDIVKVRWNINRQDRYFDFEEKEFPVADLQKMIRYYKRKIHLEFRDRNKNKTI